MHTDIAIFQFVNEFYTFYKTYLNKMQARQNLVFIYLMIRTITRNRAQA